MDLSRAPRTPRSRTLLVAGLTAALGVLATASGGVSGSSERLADRFHGGTEVSPDLVIVGIDDDTLEADDAYERRGGADAGSALQSLLRPGLSAELQAGLVQAIDAAGPRAVVWHYARPIQASDQVLQRAMSATTSRFVVPLPGEILRLDDGVPVIGLSYLPGAYVRDTLVTHDVLAADGRVDGVVRRLPLVVRSTERQEPLLSGDVAALFTDGGRAPAVRPSGRLVSVGTGERAIDVPVEAGLLLRIHYRDPLVQGGFDSGRGARGEATRSAKAAGTPYVSARALLAGEVAASTLRDRIVVVGSVTPTDAERLLVPGGPPGGLPAVLVHANAINTVLTRSFISVASGLEVLVLLLAFSGVAAASGTFLRRRSSGLVVLALVALVFVVARVRWNGGTLVPIASLLLVVLVGYIAAFLWRYRIETRQRQHVAGLFSQYVPETVAAQLLEPGEAERHAAGERLDISVLFCDLRGFTRTAASLAPPDVRDLLNTYYRHASTVVLARHGTLMQYTGDEVFAVFGAPLAIENHRAAALACALELQEALAAINDDLTAQGLPTISFGIGVNSGEVVAAHVGDERRRQYSVIGDTVNVGARLCSLAGSGEVVAVDEVLTAHGAPDARYDVDPVGNVDLKGVDRTLSLWRIRIRT